MRSILFRIDADEYGTFVTPDQEREEKGFNVPVTNLAHNAMARAIGVEFHQIAMYVPDRESSVSGMIGLGFTEWSYDSADLEGTYLDEPCTIRGNMAFNYQFLPGKELEFISYDGHPDAIYRGMGTFISHISSYVEDVDKSVEVVHAITKMTPYHRFTTRNHDNERIAGKKHFREAIFDTRARFGFNLKLIEKVVE